MTSESVVVPREPTREMLEQAVESLIEQYDANRDWDDAKDVIEKLDAKAVWSAMLAAAPAPSEDEGVVSRLTRGSCHTALMDAIHGDLMRQHPGAITEEDGNSTIAIPANGFLKMDVSGLAEAALAALSAPPADGEGAAHPDAGARERVADDRLAVAVERLRAEINAPLTGLMHGSWDRGRVAGLKEALALLKGEG